MLVPPDLISTQEAAARFGVSRNTIRRWVNAGLIEYVRLPSGRLRFSAEEIANRLEPVAPGKKEAGAVTAAVLGVIAGLVVVALIAVGVYFFIYATAEGRGRIALHNQQRTATNLQFNYEYFHDQCHAIIAEGQQITTLERQVAEQQAAPPANDPFGQSAQMLAQLRSQVTGLRNLRDADAQDYSSKANQFTRNFMQSRDLPFEIGPPSGEPYEGLVCESKP